PIVRISPHELHINDLEYYEELYVGPTTRRSEKYAWTTKQFGPSSSVFATPGHELHRIRRAALAPFFTTKRVQRLEPSVQSVIDKLIERLREFRGTGKVINILHVYTALTLDIISEYSFGRADGALDREGFARNWHEMSVEGSEMGHMNKQFGWLAPTMRAIPIRLVKILNPQLTALFDYQDHMRAQILAIKKDLANSSNGNEKSTTPTKKRTVFSDMLTNPAVRPEEKTTDHLMLEAVSVIAAGMNTTAFCLTVITYHLLRNPPILERLREEMAGMREVNGEKPSWQMLERLPYLRAVVSEGLLYFPSLPLSSPFQSTNLSIPRLGNGVSHRLARISPNVDLQYKDWTSPRGIPVSSTSLLLLHNPTIFPSPKTFKPERWLPPSHPLYDPNLKVKEKYMITFGKGSRMCLGMNLANCELYLTLFAVFGGVGNSGGREDGSRAEGGRVGLELFETEDADVEVKRDFFNAVTELGRKGVRVLVH
ncbi:MAG: hypothetical protein Q9221_008452, partial [Calogaya cf. arnoldii]